MAGRTTHRNAHIQRLGVPLLWDGRLGEKVEGATRVLCRGVAVLVDVAWQASFSSRIPNQKDTLDGVKGRTRGHVDHGVHRRCGTLRVALENDAMTGIVRHDTVDLADDLRGEGTPLSIRCMPSPLRPPSVLHRYPHSASRKTYSAQCRQGRRCCRLNHQRAGGTRLHSW